MTTTLRPCQGRCSPAVSPAGPPPTTAVSWTTGAAEAAPAASREIAAAAPALELGSGPMATVPLCSGIVTEVAPSRAPPARNPGSRRERQAASGLSSLSRRLAMYILTAITSRGSRGRNRATRRSAKGLIMVTRVQKWGNSQGVRFPLQILREANIAVGDEVEVVVQEGRIVVTPSDRIRGRYRLEDLVARMPEDYEPVEEGWGAPQGREAW